MLSRVIWPRFELEKVLGVLEKNSNEFERVCIQAVNYPNVVDDLCELVAHVKSACSLPVSVSSQPLEVDDIRKLADAGAERVSVPLDAATPDLFRRIKGGGYTWEGHLKALEHARAIFGDRVSTHLIAGLGESEEEMVERIQFLHDRGITVGLFAFTPIAGTPLFSHPRPDIVSYRRIQLARYLIANGLSRAERMRFEGGQVADFGVEWGVLNRTVKSGEPFCTSGCPGCNRPFYNESPRGPIYNYPRKPTPKEITIIQANLPMPLPNESSETF
jgi:biotin synthase